MEIDLDDHPVIGIEGGEQSLLLFPFSPLQLSLLPLPILLCLPVRTLGARAGRKSAGRTRARAATAQLLENRILLLGVRLRNISI